MLISLFWLEFSNGMEKDEQDMVVTDMEPKVFKVGHLLQCPFL